MFASDWSNRQTVGSKTAVTVDMAFAWNVNITLVYGPRL